MVHAFTPVIERVLEKQFGKAADELLERSQLLQYINIKTRSAARGSKSRSGFANLYAIYVLIEDYVQKGFDEHGDYSDYEGAIFNHLLERQRELPFGSKLQNHALNHRLNEEFKKYFPASDFVPILRESSRYWFDVNLLRVQAGGRSHDLAKAIIEIIQAYINSKRDAFDSFIRALKELNSLEREGQERRVDFVLGQLAPNVDARLFEIVGYSILKFHYQEQKVYFGYSLQDVVEEKLQLYKTGRTNANDGGIDYVMRPLGRFFQVTETLAGC